jgi:5-formyltetrahydrofolate cyclo-ligase
MNKDDVRAMMLARRASLTDDEVWLASEAIVEKISGLSAYKKALTVLFYCPFGNEVNISALAEDAFGKKSVCLPRVEPGEGEMSAREVESLSCLERAHYGILAPPGDTKIISPEDIDFILVPLVAYDENLHRIGYGGGYYDRFLPKCINAYKCGVAYSFQEIEEIKAAGHDIRLDAVVTEV